MKMENRKKRLRRRIADFERMKDGRGIYVGAKNREKIMRGISTGAMRCPGSLKK